MALLCSLLERIERRYDQLVREALAQHQALRALPSGRRGRKKRWLGTTWRCGWGRGGNPRCAFCGMIRCPSRTIRPSKICA